VTRLIQTISRIHSGIMRMLSRIPNHIATTEHNHESDNDGKAVMIVIAGDAGEEPVEGGG
jgi:hypothetical protein